MTRWRRLRVSYWRYSCDHNCIQGGGYWIFPIEVELTMAYHCRKFNPYCLLTCRDSSKLNKFHCRATVQTWQDNTLIHGIYRLLVLVSMSLTLIQGHRGTADGNSQRWIISASKQVTRMKLATTVDCFVHDLDCDFENIYMDWPPFWYDCRVVSEHWIWTLPIFTQP